VEKGKPRTPTLLQKQIADRDTDLIRSYSHPSSSLPSSSLSSSLTPATAPAAPPSTPPYQDQHDSTWGHRGKTTRHVVPDDAVAPKEGQLDGTTNGGKKKTEKGRGRWHLNKKIRKVARLEVSDAFEGQGRMLGIMAVGMTLSLVGFWVVVRWAWSALVG
jgi:hypothetical protein